MTKLTVALRNFANVLKTPYKRNTGHLKCNKTGNVRLT